DEARLLQETLDEEGRVDRRLTEMAEGHINDDARAEGDAADRGEGRLRYVDLGHGPRGRDGIEAIRIVNDADEDLGSLDGLLVEGEARAPRYVVMKTGGLLTRHRTVLPLNRVRFDEAGRTI